MILDEKSKVLFTEGQRFFDMMRLGLPIELDDNMGGIPVPVPTREKIIDWTFYKTILPIPQDEINDNPGLADQQNPGYENQDEFQMIFPLRILKRIMRGFVYGENREKEILNKKETM